jgi:DNA-binding NtrC family response regulator
VENTLTDSGLSAISPGHVREWIDAITKPARILVVDDEEGMRSLFKNLQRYWNCAIDLASSGPEALKLIFKSDYRMVFLDLRMPDMDGIEVFKRIKRDRPKTPVAILSGYLDSDAISKVQEIGFAIFIAKPVPMRPFIDEMLTTLGVIKLPPQNGLCTD